MIAVADTSRPHLADKARLKWDAVREKHLLLYPEGVLVLNQTAHDVLALCDGRRAVADIVNALAAQHARDARHELEVGPHLFLRRADHEHQPHRRMLAVKSHPGRRHSRQASFERAANPKAR